MKRRALKFTIILLALSCSETEFDADVKEQQTASNTGDATTGVDAEGMPSTTTGSEASEESEPFTRSRDKGLLDLLLVIDDSKSMEKVHAHLENGLASLLTHIDNSNWQIKIVDTDLDKKCDQPIITKANKADYGIRLGDFAATGGAQERTLQKARAALRLTPYENVCPEWLREGSTLAAVIITDENHQCDNASDPNRNADGNSFQCHGQDSVSNLIIEFNALREQTKLYGIFDKEETCGEKRETFQGYGLDCYNDDKINRDDSNCSGSTANPNPCYGRNDNYKYRSGSYLAERRNFDSILHLGKSKSEYDKFLQQISEGIKDILQDQFTLKKEPKAGTVKVTVDGSSNTDFTISGKILTFTPSLPEGADKIKVTYVPKSP